MPTFELTQTSQYVTLRTPQLELGWSLDDGALRVLRRPGAVSVIGHGPALAVVDVALGAPDNWLTERSFIRYLAHSYQEHEQAATVTVTSGLGPLKIYDSYHVSDTLITRHITIENVGLDEVQVYGLRMLAPYARIGRAETCRFEAPGNSVRPGVPLEIAASQRRTVLPRRFFAPGLRGGSALELAPTHGPGLLALHARLDGEISDHDALDTLLCWYHSEVEAALPFLEGLPHAFKAHPAAVSFGHEVGLAGWLGSEERMSCGTQFIMLVQEPWPQALGVFRQKLAEANLSLLADQAAWVRDTVIYETHPAFYGGFAGLTRALPDLATLGITTLLLLPVWEFARLHERLWDGNWSGSGSPYAIHDFEQIDSTLGAPAELRALVDTAHSLGLRVLLDLALHGCASTSRYVEERPHWFARDETGTFITAAHPLVLPVANALPPGCYGFDWNNADLQNYLYEWALDHARRYDLDGFRVVSPYNPIPNWARRLPYHASAASMAILPLLKRLRADLRRIKADAALLCDLHGPTYTAIHDACADYPVHHMFVHMALNRITPAELGNYLRDHAMALQPGSTRLCFMESHDTCDVNPLADGLRGSRISRMLIAGMLFCGFVPALWAGQERGEEMVLRELLRVWQEHPVLRYGATFYNAVACNSPQVFAVVRALDGACVLGLLNIGPHKRTVTLGLPIDLIGLAEGSYHLHELVSDIHWSEDDRHLWDREALRQFQLTLDPFGSYCVAIEAAVEHRRNGDGAALAPVTLVEARSADDRR